MYIIMGFRWEREVEMEKKRDIDYFCTVHFISDLELHVLAF